MDPETRTWKTRHEKIRATLADAGVLAVLTDEAAWRNVALTDTVLLDLALDLAAKHVDTSQNDLQGGLVLVSFFWCLAQDVPGPRFI